MKSFNKSLRSYFKQLTFFLSLTIPVFYSLKFRLEKTTPLSQLILEEFHKRFCNTGGEFSEINKSNPIEEYIFSKVMDFGINSNGMCKYCGIFNLNIDDMQLKPGYKIDKLIKKLIKSNDEYSKLITSLNIVNSGANALNVSNEEDEVYSISLMKSIFKNLPNLSNLSIQNIRIKEIESSIEECTNMKNIELLNNDLSDLPENWPPITQIIIDNNPLKTIPPNLFCIESLRSVVLNRLNIESLPDGWLQMCADNICSIRSIRITQTKLRKLPEDLIVGNRSLEQLIFQGLYKDLVYTFKQSLKCI
jgi:hypothetical protein